MVSLYYNAAAQGYDRGVQRVARKALRERFGEVGLDPQAYATLTATEISQKQEQRAQDLFDRRRLAYDALKSQYGDVAGDAQSAMALYNLSQAPARAAQATANAAQAAQTAEQAARKASLEERRLQVQEGRLRLSEEALRREQQPADQEASDGRVYIGPSPTAEGATPGVQPAAVVTPPLPQPTVTGAAPVTQPTAEAVAPGAPPMPQAVVPAAQPAPEQLQAPEDIPPVAPPATPPELAAVPDEQLPTEESQAPSVINQLHDMARSDGLVDGKGTVNPEELRRLVPRVLAQQDDPYSGSLDLIDYFNGRSLEVEELRSALNSGSVEDVAIARARVDELTKQYAGFEQGAPGTIFAGDGGAEVANLLHSVNNVAMAIWGEEERATANPLFSGTGHKVSKVLSYTDLTRYMSSVAGNSYTTNLSRAKHIFETISGYVRMNVKNSKVLDTLNEGKFLDLPPMATSEEILIRSQNIAAILGLGNIGAGSLSSADYKTLQERSPALFPKAYGRDIPASVRGASIRGLTESQRKMYLTPDRVIAAQQYMDKDPTPPVTDTTYPADPPVKKEELLQNPEVQSMLREDPGLEEVVQLIHGKDKGGGPPEDGVGVPASSVESFFRGTNLMLFAGLNIATSAAMEYALFNTSGENFQTILDKHNAREEEVATNKPFSYFAGMTAGTLALAGLAGLTVGGPVGAVGMMGGVVGLGLMYLVRRHMGRAIASMSKTIGGARAVQMASQVVRNTYGAKLGKALMVGLDAGAKAQRNLLVRGSTKVGGAAALGAGSAAVLEANRNLDPGQLANPEVLKEGALGGTVGAGASKFLGYGVKLTTGMANKAVGTAYKALGKSTVTSAQENIAEIVAPSSSKLMRTATLNPGRPLIDFLNKSELQTLKRSVSGDASAYNAYINILGESSSRINQSLMRKAVPRMKGSVREATSGVSVYKLARSLNNGQSVDLSQSSSLATVKSQLNSVFATSLPTAPLEDSPDFYKSLLKTNLVKSLTDRRIVSDENVGVLSKLKKIASGKPASPVSARELNDLLLTMRRRLQGMSGAAAKEGHKVETALVNYISDQVGEISLPDGTPSTYASLNAAYQNISSYATGLKLGEKLSGSGKLPPQILSDITNAMSEVPSGYKADFQAGLIVGRNNIVRDAVENTKPDVLRKLLTQPGLFKAFYPDSKTRLKEFQKLRKVYHGVEAVKIRQGIEGSLTPLPGGKSDMEMATSLVKLVAIAASVKTLVAVPFRAIASTFMRQAYVREDMLKILASSEKSSELVKMLSRDTLTKDEAVKVAPVLVNMWRTLKDKVGPTQAREIMQSPVLWGRMYALAGPAQEGEMVR